MTAGRRSVTYLCPCLRRPPSPSSSPGPCRASDAATRIPSGTETGINAALSGGGATAVLCPDAVFTLPHPVTFTAPDVTAENAGAAPLIVNRPAIGPWEEFDLIQD